MDICYEPTSAELYHHGIKGQKWGVRRFQDKSGRLTNAGKKRYSEDSSGGSDKSVKKKSKHRTNLEEKYRKAGLSKREAEEAADKRIRAEKIVAAAAGVTVAAATAYVVHNNLKVKSDGIIRATDKLQRVEMTDEGKLYDSFYVAKDRSDRTKYAGKLGMTRKLQTGKAYVMEIEAKNDIKIAGQDKAMDTFKRLYDDDPHFKSMAEDLARVNAHGGNQANGNYKKMYENFNTNLIKHDNPAVKKFYQTLKDEGYGAVRDVNDMKFSGYNAKNPLIVFGQSDNVSVKSFREMTDSEIGRQLIADGAKESVKSLKVYGPLGLSALTAGMIAEDYDPNSTPAYTREQFKNRLLY